MSGFPRRNKAGFRAAAIHSTQPSINTAISGLRNLQSCSRSLKRHVLLRSIQKPTIPPEHNKDHRRLSLLNSRQRLRLPSCHYSVTKPSRPRAMRECPITSSSIKPCKYTTVSGWRDYASCVSAAMMPQVAPPRTRGNPSIPKSEMHPSPITGLNCLRDGARVEAFKGDHPSITKAFPVGAIIA